MSSQQTQRPPFEPRPAGPAGTVTWIHLGDLHMKRAGAQNEIDLDRIVEVINEIYAQQGISFVYLPGDIADDGSAASYRIVRSHLDKLSIPWCGVVGDHDVHEESFENFRTYIARNLTSGFTVGQYRFLRLNAFSRPRPDAFVVDADQLAWIEQELQSCEQQKMHAVLLLHCYPSDLKQGGDGLAALIRKYPVLLVDMGHTHYNEISNDGHALYSATRSTGQIEEGPVGFSVVTLDNGGVSWHFVHPDAPELLAITSPSDRRLDMTPQRDTPPSIMVHAMVWSRDPVTRVDVTLQERTAALHHDAGNLWSGQIAANELPAGDHKLLVEAATATDKKLSDTIEIHIGPSAPVEHAPTDQNNALGAWEEREILGTQLGPNKNGRKW